MGKKPGEKPLGVTKDNKGDEQQVEAITASTITSRAFLTAVNNAYNAYKSQSVDGVSGATSNAENKKD